MWAPRAGLQGTSHYTPLPKIRLLWDASQAWKMNVLEGSCHQCQGRAQRLLDVPGQGGHWAKQPKAGRQGLVPVHAPSTCGGS